MGGIPFANNGVVEAMLQGGHLGLQHAGLRAQIDHQQQQAAMQQQAQGDLNAYRSGQLALSAAKLRQAQMDKQAESASWAQVLGAPGHTMAAPQQGPGIGPGEMGPPAPEDLVAQQQADGQRIDALSHFHPAVLRQLGQVDTAITRNNAVKEADFQRRAVEARGIVQQMQASGAPPREIKLAMAGTTEHPGKYPEFAWMVYDPQEDQALRTQRSHMIGFMAQPLVASGEISPEELNQLQAGVFNDEIPTTLAVQGLGVRYKSMKDKMAAAAHAQTEAAKHPPITPDDIAAARRMAPSLKIDEDARLYLIGRQRGFFNQIDPNLSGRSVTTRTLEALKIEEKNAEDDLRHVERQYKDAATPGELATAQAELPKAIQHVKTIRQRLLDHLRSDGQPDLGASSGSTTGAVPAAQAQPPLRGAARGTKPAQPEDPVPLADQLLEQNPDASNEEIADMIRRLQGGGD